MTFPFDLEAATNAIAALELAVVGIGTSYGYNANPVEVDHTDLATGAVVVHSPLGPRNAADGVVSGLLSYGSVFQLDYRITSRVLFSESKGENYPADEAGASVLWKVIADAFFNHANRTSLATSAGAHTYSTEFADPSFGIKPWPMDSPGFREYWALEYNHIFTFTG